MTPMLVSQEQGLGSKSSRRHVDLDVIEREQ
jgi:hypothetical protein